MGDASTDGTVAAAALRGLAAVWSRNAVRHVTPQVLDEYARLVVSDAASMVVGGVPSNATSLPQPGQGAPAPPDVVNDDPITDKPLYAIVSLAVCAIGLEFAFGPHFRRARPEGAPAGPSSLSMVSEAKAAAPSTDREAAEAAQEWAHFKRTKMHFLVLACLIGFASEFLLWMLAPFLPEEGAARGVSPEVVGLLFACHPIALGLASQLAPMLMTTIEPFVLLERTLLFQAIFIGGFGLAGPLAPPTRTPSAVGGGCCGSDARNWRGARRSAPARQPPMHRPARLPLHRHPRLPCTLPSPPFPNVCVCVCVCRTSLSLARAQAASQRRPRSRRVWASTASSSGSCPDSTSQLRRRSCCAWCPLMGWPTPLGSSSRRASRRWCAAGEP